MSSKEGYGTTTPTQRPTSKVNQLKDPNVSFWEKWNNHVSKKKSDGIIRHAPLANRWVPRFFYFFCIGGTGWIIFGSIPTSNDDSYAWMIFMEIFTVYVFLQVMVNYFLIKITDSTYKSDKFPTLMNQQEDSTPTVQRSSSTAIAAYAGVNQDGADSDQRNPSADPLESNYLEASTFKIRVVTSVHGNEIERQSVSYWSWVPCVICNKPRPPRCHHCTLCGKCILKRDHHCYFTKACIGVNNHVYYICFLFWCVVLTWHGSFQLVPYLYNTLVGKYSYWNIIFPYNLYTTIIGDLPIAHLHLIAVVWGVVFLTFISSGMFGNSILLMLRGLTSFENSNRIKVVDTRSYSGRMHSVLGRNWAIKLFMTGYVAKRLSSHLPSHLRTTDPLEDAIEWPYVKTT